MGKGMPTNEIRYSLIKLAATALADRQRTRIVCPFCEGGSTEEVSMSITKANPKLLFWRCFRNSCGRHGVISDGFIGEPKEPVHKGREPTPFLGRTELLPPSVVQFIKSSYGIKPATINREHWKFCTSTKGLVMPIWSWLGYQIGNIVKNYAKDSPKVMSYWDKPDAVKACFPLTGPHKGSDLWIVEDIISATRIAQKGYDACALMGTWMPLTLAQHLRAIDKERLFVALDADTWKTNERVPAPVRIQKRYQLMFDTVKLVRILHDPKDMNDAELNETLRVCDAA